MERHHLEGVVHVEDHLEWVIARLNDPQYERDAPPYVRNFLGPYVALVPIVPLYPALSRRLILKAINWLVSNGARVNDQDIAKCSALHLAFNYPASERYALLKTLLDAGADVNLMTIQGETPLDLLCADPSFEQMTLALSTMLQTATKATMNSGIHQAVKNYIHISGCCDVCECERRHLNSFRSVVLLLIRGADFDVQCLRETILKLRDTNLPLNCLITFINMSKTLIKWTIFRNLNKKDYMLQQLNIRDVLTVDDNNNLNKMSLIGLIPLISNYLNMCFSEIEHMHTDKIGHNYELYEFVQDFFKIYPPISEDISITSKEICIDKLLEILLSVHRGKYICFEAVIHFNLRHCDLLKLDYMLRTSEVGKVPKNSITGLNHDCFREISKYLTKTELLNFITAMFSVFNS